MPPLGSMPETPAGLVLLVSRRRTPDDSLVYQHLCDAGLRVRQVCDLGGAVRSFRAESPDLLLIGPDAMAGARGADVARRIRRGGFHGMILVVGRTAGHAAAVAALDSGADDYVALSRDPTELLARVRALGRRGAGPRALEREVAGVVLDLRRGVLRRDDTEVALTRREADLLEYLARHAGRPVSRGELAVRVWHAVPPGGTGTNVVDVYVSYLRRKLAAVGRQSLIKSVRGIGYELVEGRDVATPV